MMSLTYKNYDPEVELVQLQDTWLKRCVEFWQHEILRWDNAGLLIVLNNDTQKSLNLLVQLVNEVDNPLFDALMKPVPQATIPPEFDDEMDVKMSDLRHPANFIGSSG